MAGKARSQASSECRFTAAARRADSAATSGEIFGYWATATLTAIVMTTTVTVNKSCVFVGMFHSSCQKQQYGVTLSPLSVALQKN